MRKSFSTPKNAISSAGIQVASRLMIIGPPFLLRLHVYRHEVEVAVEVHADDAVGALFARVIMDLSSRLRPRPAEARSSRGTRIRPPFPVLCLQVTAKNLCRL